MAIRILLLLMILVHTACDQASSPTATKSAGAQITGMFPYGAGPGADVTIVGKGFGNSGTAAQILVGGIAATISTWADEEIVFVMPSGVVGNVTDVTLQIGSAELEAGSFFAWEPGVIQLTNTVGGIGASSPTWSLDGNWIYYVQHVESENQYDIFRVRATGGLPQNITNTPYDENWPDINFSSGELVFASNSTNSGNTSGDYDIWISGQGYLNPVDPSFNLQDDLERTPSWSRSVMAGINLAYTRVESSGTNIWVSGSSGILRLTSGTNARFDPTNGQWIAFVDYNVLTPYIYKMDVLNTASRELLSTPSGIVGDLDWGVNGKIAYTTSDPNSDIWMMDDDGTDHEKVLGLSGVSEYAPRWSPTADRVAFGSHRFSDFNIFVYTIPTN